MKEVLMLRGSDALPGANVKEVAFDLRGGMCCAPGAFSKGATFSRGVTVFHFCHDS